MRKLNFTASMVATRLALPATLAVVLLLAGCSSPTPSDKQISDAYNRGLQAIDQQIGTRHVHDCKVVSSRHDIRVGELWKGDLWEMACLEDDRYGSDKPIQLRVSRRNGSNVISVGSM